MDRIIQPKLRGRRTYRRRAWVSRRVGMAVFLFMLSRVPTVVSKFGSDERPPWWIRIFYQVRDVL